MARTNNKDVHRGVVLYLDGKEVANNAKAIRAEMKKVKQEIDGMTRGSEEYYRATKRYRELDKILQQHRSELKHVEQQQTSWLSRGIKFFKDYSLQIGGAIQAITGVAMQLQQFRRQMAEKEDAAANLKALTGLDDSNIQWLTEQAEKLSTTMEKSGLRVRKSATEILEAYMLVGSKKPELLQDKEALNAVTIETMRLAEAAKMELKDAVAGLTLAMNQYGASAEEASRYVNVLAAGSKYGAVGVATQTESIVKAGVAASTAKVPIEQLIGVIETLGEKGIEGSIAGTQLKTFFLKLEAGAEETRPSVVGLQTALERLAAKNLDVTEMTKMFGLESITTAKALISSAEKVKYYTEAVTDTNVATEQAAINSDTTAARMAQVRNQINLTGQELAKTLAPILSKTVNWTNKFVMALPALIEWIRKWGLEVLVLVAAYTTYTYGMRVATAVTKAWHTVQLAVITTMGHMRSIITLTTAAINFNSKAMVTLGLQLRSMNALSKSFAAGQALVRAALLAVTGQTTQAARAMGVFQLVMKSVNPWVAAATAIAAVGTAIFIWQKRAHDAIHVNKQLQQAQQDATERYEEQRAHIEYLNKVVHDETLGYQRRNAALEELKQLVPGYHASLSTEKGLIDDNTTAIDNYLDRLKKEITLRAMQEQYVETLKEQARARRKVEEEEEKAAKHYNARMDEQEGKRNPATGFNPLRWMWHSAAEQYYDARKSSAQTELDNAIKDGEELQKMIDDIEHQLDEVFEKAGTSGEGKNNPGGGGNGGKPEKEAEKQKEIREAIAAVDLEYDAKANELKRKYLEGEIETAEEYADKMQKLELERLNKQLAIAGLEPAQREAIQSKIYDLSLKMKNELLKLEEKQKQEAEKAAEERVRLSKEEMERLILEARSMHAKEELDEKNFLNKITNLKRSFFQVALKEQSLSAEKRKQLEREYTEFEVQEEEKRSEEQKKALDKRNEEIKKSLETIKEYSNDFGDALSTLIEDLFTKEEDAGKTFLKSLVKMVFKAVRALSAIWIGSLSGRNFANHDWEEALLLTALETAAIEAAISVAEGVANGLIANLYTGGYTGPGQWDEPRGIVHAGEFVANRYAVANDAVRPVLDLIDQAQKNGSIANLTAEQIAAVARPSAAPAPAATASVGSDSGVPARDPELTAAIRLLTRTTARAAEAYQEPSPAYCWAEGHGGVNEAQAFHNKMKSNASRKL